MDENKNLFDTNLAIFPIMVAKWDTTPDEAIIVYQNDALKDKIGSWKGRGIFELLEQISCGSGGARLVELVEDKSIEISGKLGELDIKYHARLCKEHIQMAITDNTEIHKLRDREQRANLINSFLNIGSHELLTPLNVILSSAWGMLQDDISDEQRTGLKYIEEYANRLNDTVAKMLQTIYEDETTDLDISCNGPIDISATINDLRSKIIEKIDNKISTNFDLQSRSSVCMSKRHFTDIIIEISINLRRNTPAGKNVLFKTYDTDGSVNIVIENECFGIPPEELDKIFDPLYRYQDPVKHSSGFDYGQGGIGMGLTAIKKLIQLSGGKIWLENLDEYAPDKENIVRMNIELPK